MLVNAALEVVPQDPDLAGIVAGVLLRIEAFFRHCIAAGQADGTITRSLPADDLARHLLGVLMGVRVLARVRPEPALLEGVVAPALALLDVPGGEAAPGRISKPSGKPPGKPSGKPRGTPSGTP
jgi:TetR/AcrR family transcriptional regulator, transcriptional repressor for nem operon